MSLSSRTLGVFLHTTSAVVAALTSVVLVGFFLSSDWSTGSLASGNPEQMLTAQSDFKLQAALHVPVNAQSFAAYNQSAVNQCPPTVSTACPASVSGMLWGALLLLSICVMTTFVCRQRHASRYFVSDDTLL